MLRKATAEATTTVTATQPNLQIIQYLATQPTPQVNRHYHYHTPQTILLCCRRECCFPLLLLRLLIILLSCRLLYTPRPHPHINCSTKAIRNTGSSSTCHLMSLSLPKVLAMVMNQHCRRRLCSVAVEMVTMMIPLAAVIMTTMKVTRAIPLCSKNNRTINFIRVLSTRSGYLKPNVSRAEMALNVAILGMVTYLVISHKLFEANAVYSI